jgi:hypothetical protein
VAWPAGIVAVLASPTAPRSRDGVATTGPAGLPKAVSVTATGSAISPWVLSPARAPVRSTGQ